jgi:hypothetical protein
LWLLKEATDISVVKLSSFVHDEHAGYLRSSRSRSTGYHCTSRFRYVFSAPERRRERAADAVSFVVRPDK